MTDQPSTGIVPSLNPAQEGQLRLRKLLIEDGLYSKVSLADEPGKMLAQMLTDELFAQFDLHCTICKMVTPYRIKTGKIKSVPLNEFLSQGIFLPNIIALNAVCLRASHFVTYVLLRLPESLTKIGQNPSYADLALGELRAIDRSLDPLDRKELGRALGLFGHDAHLGAFVYLRRVFERMILRAHERHVSAGLPAIEDFSEMRMEDRISGIQDQLPAKVVTNRRVFAVLSKGIHELTDEDAKALFPLLKTIIFQMLGEEERLRAATEQDRATDAAFADVLSKLGGATAPDR